MSTEIDSKNPLKLFWVIMLTLLGLAGALIGVFKDYRWAVYFIPDWLVLSAVSTFAYYAHHRWLKNFIPSLWNALNTSNKLHRTGTLLLLLIVIIGGFFISSVSLKYYRLRLFSAKFDWHYAYAKNNLEKGLYKEALNEFEKQGEHFSYLPKTTSELAIIEIDDTRKRLLEVDTYLGRVNEALDSNKTPNFMDLLLAQRAFTLYPKSAAVKEAKNRAVQRLNLALESYFKSITYLQRGNYRLAKQEMIVSRGHCQRLLHQDLLLKYCDSSHQTGFSKEDIKVSDFYLKTQIGEIRKTILESPLLNWISE